LALRPKDFSVTEIDMLRRDPYAIHARRILGLSPLPDLTRAPDAAERGTLFHAILAAHLKQGLDPDAPDAEAALLSLARRMFDGEALEPGIDAVWWPRFAALAPDIIAFEKEQKARTKRRSAEVSSARHPVLSGHTLRARADRIDRLADGSVMVMDWKTGSSPALKAARDLSSAQVALEAALVERGAFGPEATGPVAELLFLRLKDKGVFKRETIAPREKGSKDDKVTVTPQDMAGLAWERLESLLAIFNTDAHPYLSRANPLKRRKDEDEEDYDHLARFAEWSSTAGEEGEAEDDDAEGEGGEA
jgi:ATP-dependent helicase/nuclease subunit B